MISTGRPAKYKWFVLLPLLLENRPRRPVALIKVASYLLGPARPSGLKPLMTNALTQLVKAGILGRRSIRVLPKRRSPWQKGAPYTRRHRGPGGNHAEGRYEAAYFLNYALPPAFVARLRHDCARFFGFRSWFDGLTWAGWRMDDVMLNVRNSYAHTRKCEAAPSRGACREITPSNTATKQTANDAAEIEASEALMTRSSRLSRRTRALIRKHAPDVLADRRRSQQSQAVSGAELSGQPTNAGTARPLSLPST
jgi:hypothetical protein